jgi:hypothetical protein
VGAGDVAGRGGDVQGASRVSRGADGVVRGLAGYFHEAASLPVAILDLELPLAREDLGPPEVLAEAGQRDRGINEEAADRER